MFIYYDKLCQDGDLKITINEGRKKSCHLIISLKNSPNIKRIWSTYMLQKIAISRKRFCFKVVKLKECGKKENVTSLCIRLGDIAFATCMPQYKIDYQTKSLVRSQKERTEILEVEYLKKIRTSNRRNAITEMMIVETIGLAGFLEQCFI